MSGNHVTIGNYADPEELATSDDLEATEADDTQEAHVTNDIILVG
jgi:hypothetical protein